MVWSRKFPEPLKTSDGKALRTLAEARDFILKLPAGRTWRNEWQHAAATLLAAAKGEVTASEAREAVRSALFLNLMLDFGD